MVMFRFWIQALTLQTLPGFGRPEKHCTETINFQVADKKRVTVLWLFELRGTSPYFLKKEEERF